MRFIHQNEVTEVRSRWREIISTLTSPAKDKVNGETSYICPICGHGGNGDGLTYNPQSGKSGALHCFGCGFSGDIIDLIVQTRHKNFNEALKEAADIIGLSIKDCSSESKAERQTALDHNRQEQENAQTEEAADYTNFFLQAQKNNTGEYLERRGISKAIQDLFKVGYVAEWKHPKAPNNAPARPYIIFPTSKATYSTRYTGNDDIGKYKKSKVGHNAPFFCKKLAFESTSPIFVVEGETDALSIWELGHAAISLGSVNNAMRFIDLAKKNKEKTYIISLDNDGAGKGAAQKIKEAFENSRISFLMTDISGSYKDPNERLVNDKEGLSRALRMAELQVTDSREYARQKLRENNVAAQINDFWEDVRYRKNFPPIETGFPLLDDFLDGGLFPEQLVFMGAVSSLGKTTFLLQVMDNIAAAGTPVLLFSLEMSRNEIMAKSISRYTFTTAIKDNIRTNNAKTMRGISAGYRYEKYNQTEKDLINKASKLYAEGAGKNIYIYEGNGDTSVDEVIQTAKEFIKLTGEKPLVFIDYLQILAPHDPKMTDKQNTDYSVKVLKQLARDESIVVFAISSLNRESYGEPISMTSFKESGAIEYSSDVLIGLQFKDIEIVDDRGRRRKNKEFDISKAKEENPRKIDMKVLKSRSGGMSSNPLHYLYYPAFNYYQETTKE